MKRIFALLVLCIIAFSSNAWAQFNMQPWQKLPSQDLTLKVPEWTGNSSGNMAEDAAKMLILDKAKVKTPDSVNDDVTKSETQSTGKPTSGNVEKPSFVGSSNLSSEYYGSDKCGGGNIFQQLACRAGTIGSGLKTAGYMIAGFGLIVFAFAAIFGKVKWPLFATIAFSCFLLSITMAVINMMTKDGERWMGDVSGAGSISTSATDQPKGNTDANEVSKDKS